MGSHFLYQFGPGSRPELATNPDAWTADDERVGGAHFAYLTKATEDGIVILAGRCQDGIGPAVVIFEADNEEAAVRFMRQDPFIAEGLFTATIHAFNAALMRTREGHGG
jgi:uncharacterized protein YciI